MQLYRHVGIYTVHATVSSEEAVSEFQLFHQLVVLSIQGLLNMPSFTLTFNDDVVEKPALWSNTKKISFEDYLELTACVFNWGDSYDAKVNK